MALKPTTRNKFKINREFVLYGLVMGLLIIFLQALNYETVIHRLSSDAFNLTIAIVFLGIGLWVGFLYLNKAKPEPDTNPKASDGFGLSKRELEVLALIAKGHSNQEIADRLFVSLNTVKTHLSNIFSKMAVQRRTQAVQKARDQNIL